MKKIIYLFTMIALFLSSCNPNEEIYDELDKQKEAYNGTVVYTLASADYTKLSGYAKADAINALDSTWAGYIATFQAFNDSFPGSVYIPKVLPSLFPAYNKNSVAIVTYNYFAEMPEEYSLYTDATVFEFNQSGYLEADDMVAAAGYFYPKFNPDFYIPDILKTSITDATSNDIYRIKYKYSDVDPVFSVTNVFEELFDIDLGNFNAYSVTGDQGWFRATYGADTYAKMSGFTGGTAYVNEDWLISDPIVLGNDSSISFSFNQAIRYLNNRWDQISVAVSSDFDSTDIAGATWDVIDWSNIDNTENLGTSYNIYNSGDIDISSYAGDTIYIAFKYTSDLTNQATWQIYDVKVTPIKPIYAVTYGKASYTVNDYYKYTGSAWVKQENVHFLNSKEYDAMGAPGSYDNFSTTVKPMDYLPKYLDSKYPAAGDGISAIVVYNYYVDSAIGTNLIADKLTYTSGEWVSSYSFIATTTEQFVYSNAGWLFDPTVKFTMVASDYYIIVNAVLDENPSYGYTDRTREFYYGAVGKYSNFDLRLSNKATFGIPGYDGLSEEAAIEETWRRIPEAIDLMLKLKYPNAVTNVAGVDVHYYITFYSYENDLKSYYYTIHFQCTKSGPNPEFEVDLDYATDTDKAKVWGRFGIRKL